MYTYKIVKMKHSCWTGKSKQSLQELIDEHAAEGWRFVQVYESAMNYWYGRYYKEIIFEKPTENIRESSYSNSFDRNALV